MTNKKDVKKASNKIVYIFFLVGLVILLLLGFIYYQMQRPNYRDLEKAFSELNIPQDWMLEDKGGVSGWKGLFCFTAGIDEACPVFGASFSKKDDIDPVDDMALIGNMIEPTRFRVIEKDYNDCNIMAEKYYCSVLTTSAGIRLHIGIRHEDGLKKLYIALNR
jgi:hypothetical protein